MKFLHRNGEDVAPEQPGIYWFLEPREEIYLTQVDERLYAWTFGNEVEYRIDKFPKGTRWWGPVKPPKVK